MIAKFPRLVENGQFIKLRGHNVSDPHYLQWWKVAGREGETLLLIDRRGKTSRLSIPQAELLRWKVLIWEPGDPRDDETLADLPR